MKTFLYILLPFIFLTASCDSDDNDCQGIDCLPAATQTGENTFGCLVNGEAFLDTGNFNAFYQLVNGEFFFFLGADGNTMGISEIELFSDSIELSENINYPLVSENEGSITGYVFFNNSAFITTMDDVPGIINFTRFDLSQNIASGTFEFSVIDLRDNSIIEIREGRFDVTLGR